MSRLPWLLALLLWPSLRCSAHWDIDRETERGATLTVVVHSGNQPSSAAFEEMKREVQSIMSAGWVQVEWRAKEAAEQGEVFERLMVARFVGGCRFKEIKRPELQAGALGFTHITDGEILPFAELNCDQVLASIEAAVRGQSPARAQTLFGRALARVLAHEMYHILTGNSQHDRTGVAKCPLTPQELTDAKLALEARTAEAIRASLAPRRWTARAQPPADSSANPSPVTPRNIPKGSSYVE